MNKKFNVAKSRKGALAEWTELNGAFVMTGTHRLVVIEDGSAKDRIFPKEPKPGKVQKRYRLLESVETKERFNSVEGLLEELNERMPELKLLKITGTGDNKVAELNSTVPLTMDEFGTYQPVV